MLNKNLNDILNNLINISDELEKASERLIEDACEKLIPLLIKLESSYCLSADYYELENEKIICIDLRDFIPCAIRYCGSFYNVFYIRQDKNRKSYDRISLAFGVFDGDDDWGEQFTDDGYHGDSGVSRKEININNIDVYNFHSLLRQFQAFFRNTPYFDDYESFVFNNKYETINGLYSRLVSEVDVPLYNLLEQYVQENGIKQDEEENKFFVFLPYDTNIRYRGRFCNSIIKSEKNISLGYIIRNGTNIVEKDYGSDLYTCEHMLIHNNPEFVILHEIPLCTEYNNWRETIQALKGLINII